MDVILITHSLHGIPQKLHEVESLDISLIKSHLLRAGCEVNVLTHCAFMALEPSQISGKYIWYASAQYPEFSQYIEDCLLYAELCGADLVPDFPLFRSHENKFFQELLKKKLGLDVPKAELVGTREDINDILPKLHFPLVLKTPAGFGSKGVFKISSNDELMATAEKVMTHIHPPASNPLRRFKNKRSYNDKITLYKNKYPVLVGRVILQEFIEGLSHDWKILVFGETCFCLKRYTREGDFRASGSGKFSFDEVPSDSLLDYALHVVKKLNTPWASLDIAEFNGDEYGLIEYQCVHFGLYTLMRGSRCYEQIKGAWVVRSVENPSPEEYFCNAFLNYINNASTDAGCSS